jgi:hypothetical protein
MPFASVSGLLTNRMGFRLHAVLLYGQTQIKARLASWWHRGFYRGL